MFLEAYANGGRWGYFWWPGVDARTRRLATAPDGLKDRIRFIAAHRELYEQATSMNDLAVLYLDGPITRRPETHQKYLALAQALAEAGHQFDVLYGGDGEFNPDELDLGGLRRYRAVLVPEARDLGVAPAGALERYARSGGDLLVFSASPLDPSLARHQDGQVLFDFWRHYREEDRERIVATVDGLTASRIRASHPAVGVLRYAVGDRQVLHLLNYGYVAEDDCVVPVRDLRVRVPWGAAGAASCTLVRLDGDRAVPSRIEGDELVVEVPELDLYAMLVLREVRDGGRRRRHLGGLLV
jgi:hypothetical protein